MYEVVECNNVGSILHGNHKLDHNSAHWNTLVHLCYITQANVKNKVTNILAPKILF